ncbi:universal stress protein [Paenisporosarcina sp. TG20]|uniref:universal stress protein n=1 Tax=Paenisporosarcina sp. TG20 TaxID=1211706 RepID=UPI0002FD3031|nr:universal stress protein [Paenisporosarcina sp. TG20]
MFNKMIVGYDGSEGSRAALSRAVDLLRNRPDTSLIVAYVNDYEEVGQTSFLNENLGTAPVLTDINQAPTVPLDADNQLAKEYENKMIESIQLELNKHRVEARVEVITGHPATALTNLAEQEEVDAIVVGNSGKSGFQRFFVGSISEKIVKDSPCTVIVVK